MISDTVIVALIVGIPPTVASIAALIVAVGNSRKSKVRDERVEEIHRATNSMKDALVAATASASKAEGREQGLAVGAMQEKARAFDAGEKNAEVTPTAGTIDAKIDQKIDTKIEAARDVEAGLKPPETKSKGSKSTT